MKKESKVPTSWLDTMSAKNRLRLRIRQAVCEIKIEEMNKAMKKSEVIMGQAKRALRKLRRELAMLMKKVNRKIRKLEK
mgnify:CR=1 FL=1